MKKLLILTILLVQAWSAYSQTYVFKVLASKGDSQYKPDSQSEWQPVKTGTSLNSGAILKVIEEAYLGLIHSTGRTQELTIAGTFIIDDLATKMESKKSGLAGRYAEFVMNRISEAKEGDQLTATGAVTRSLTDADLSIISPISSELFSDKPTLYWNGNEEENYRVEVKSMFDEVLFEGTAKGSSYQVDLGIDELKEQDIFFVVVSSRDDPSSKSDPIGLERLSKDKALKIEEQLIKLGEEVQENTSLGELVIGSYFEENNLVIDAQNHYQRALELSPGVDDYELLYQDFLNRNSLR